MNNISFHIWYFFRYVSRSSCSNVNLTPSTCNYLTNNMLEHFIVAHIGQERQTELYAHATCVQ